MMQLTSDEYLDAREVSPEPFRAAESAGWVTAERQPANDGPLVYVDAEASEVISLVTEHRQRIAALEALALALVGDRRPKIR